MPNGQHEAGKHSRAGKKRAEANPRVPKNPKNAKNAKTSGTVYQGSSAKPSIIGRLFGKK